MFCDKNGNIVALDKNEIFVFGSNLAGRHGAGAAKTAYRYFKARMGVGYGLTGRSFAIPTKDENIQSLSYPEVCEFIREAVVDMMNINMAINCFEGTYKFIVTEIGCGLAGFTVEQIAWAFNACVPNPDIYLPVSFKPFMLEKWNYWNERFSCFVG